MLFHKSTKSISDLNLKINNNHIAKVTTFNFLGLHLSSNLSWATHVRQNLKSYWCHIQNAVSIPKTNFMIIVQHDDSTTRSLLYVVMG